MVTTESFHYVRSDAKTDLQGSLTANASAFVDLQVVPGVARGQAKGYITSLKIQSMQNLDWRVEFHSRRLSQASAGFFAATATRWNSLLGYVGFTNNAATAYATSYLYYTHGLKIPYLDEDSLGEIHCNVLNQHASTAKSAGDAGAIHIAIGFIGES